MTELKQRGEGFGQAKFRSQFQPGMTLYGYCCGIFGRDSYGDKVIQAVYSNGIVVKEDGHIIAVDVDDWKGLLESSNEALRQEEQEEEYFKQGEDDEKTD